MNGFIIRSTDNGYVTYWAYGNTWTEHRDEATRFASASIARQHIVVNGWHGQRQAVGSLDTIPATEVQS